MIKHVVCHKIVDHDSAVKAAEMLNALNGKVPGLINMCAGVDVLHSARSYELGITADFTDLASLKVYDVFPEHVEIKKFIASVKDNSHPSVAVDFEY